MNLIARLWTLTINFLLQVAWIEHLRHIVVRSTNAMPQTDTHTCSDTVGQCWTLEKTAFVIWHVCYMSSPVVLVFDFCAVCLSFGVLACSDSVVYLDRLMDHVGVAFCLAGLKKNRLITSVPCSVFLRCSKCPVLVCLIKQQELQLIMEGLLNICWGLKRPIRLQMYDHNQRFHYSHATIQPSHLSNRCVCVWEQGLGLLAGCV